MTNTIPPISQPATPPLTEAQSPQAAPPAASSIPATAGEIVTLSATAAKTTKLLGDARQADGIDHEAVAQIRSALQAGTYNVPPEELARAIVNVLRDSQG